MTTQRGWTVITGANRGIGLELCRTYAQRGGPVLALCRKASPELRGLGVQVLEGVDVAEGAAASKVEGVLDGAPIDLLIHNAGLLEPDTLDSVAKDSLVRHFEVNAVAPVVWTARLRPHFRSGSKVAILTSRMGSIGDGPSGGYYGYRMSKTAVNMAAACLAKDLSSLGVAVALLHPGFVRTGMTQGQGNLEAHESARMLVARIDALTMKTSGQFLHASGESLPW